jgi:CO/xanthine dehydrogenase Mo-binding subunit
VKFHSELLNYIDIPVMDIHGKQKQQKRTTSFFQFCKEDKGILPVVVTAEAPELSNLPADTLLIRFGSEVSGNTDAAFSGSSVRKAARARAASIAASACATSMGAAAADSVVTLALSGDKECEAA